MQFPFIGGSYPNASPRADAQNSLNLYPETGRSGSGKSKRRLIGTPGLSAPFVTLPTSPNRGTWIGDDRMFAVAGSKLYEVFQNQTYTQRGDVGNNGLPVQIFPNGNQLAVVSNGSLYADGGAGPVLVTFPGNNGSAHIGFNIFGFTSQSVFWDSGDLFDSTMLGKVLTIGGIARGQVIQVLNGRVLLIDTPWGYASGAYSVPGATLGAGGGTFMEGYAVINVPNSPQINISALYDFTTWDPNDYAVKEGYPDHLVATIANRTNLYLLGKQTLEIWRVSGNADFPFERIPGQVLQIGTIAPSSPDKLLDGIALLGTDSRGGPAAFLIQGYQWQRISTPELETIWQKYSTVADAVGFSYEDGGHEFWQISFPTADKTWCYDGAEKEWHQRAYSADGVAAHRTRAAFHGYVWGNHYVADWQSGAIYQMSRDNYTDAGSPIIRQRVAPHISDDDNFTAYPGFVLDVQTGEIAHPLFTFDYADDGGNTFKAARTLDGGPLNQYATRLQARRLGSGRNRTFRVTSTAAMRHVWNNAYLTPDPRSTRG